MEAGCLFRHLTPITGWTDDPVAELSDSELENWKNSDRIIYLKNTGVIYDSNDQVVSDIVFGVILQKTGEQRDII